MSNESGLFSSTFYNSIPNGGDGKMNAFDQLLVSPQIDTLVKNFALQVAAHIGKLILPHYRVIYNV